MLEYTPRYIQKKNHHEITGNSHFEEAEKLQEWFQAQEDVAKRE